MKIESSLKDAKLDNMENAICLDEYPPPITLNEVLYLRVNVPKIMPNTPIAPPSTSTMRINKGLFINDSHTMPNISGKVTKANFIIADAPCIMHKPIRPTFGMKLACIFPDRNICKCTFMKFFP